MKKPFVVLIDTNILIYDTKLLKTSFSAAVFYVLKKKNGKIGMPEVLEYELKKHLQKHIMDAIEGINKGYRDLESLMGYRDDYKVPKDEEVEKRFTERMEEIKEYTIPMSFTIEHAKAALKRVIDEIPPNSIKNQQFKDSVIWESLLEYSQEHDVYFITKDKGFFEERQPDKGLAKPLKKEIEGKNIKVYYKELSRFLDFFKDKIPPLDNDKIASIIFEALKEPFKNFCEEHSYEVRNLNEYIIEPYLTEEPSIIAIDYELCVNVLQIDESTTEQIEAHGIIRGNTTFNLDNDILGSTPLSRVEGFFDLEGKRLRGGLYVHTTDIGSRKIYHKFKEPMPFTNITNTWERKKE